MGEIISLAAEKAAREPTLTGEARCLGCGHEWGMTVPEGTTWLQCPACLTYLGRFQGPVERDEPHWHCLCGNDLFSITERGVYCPVCGVWHGFTNRPPAA